MIYFSPCEIAPETLLHLPPLPKHREPSYVSYICRALWVFKTLEKLLGSLYGSIQKEVAGGQGGKGSV